MNQNIKEETETRLIPVTEWNKFQPWPPVGGLRHLIFNARTNGFDKVIRRVGRRILIDEKKFFEFVEEKNQKEGANACG